MVTYTWAIAEETITIQAFEDICLSNFINIDVTFIF